MNENEKEPDVCRLDSFHPADNYNHDFVFCFHLQQFQAVGSVNGKKASRHLL